MIQSRTLVRWLPQPIKRLIKRQLAPWIRFLTDMVSTTELDDEDVFIIGYPKSGNTWFQNLVVGVMYGVDPEYVPMALIRELVPGVSVKRYYKRFTTPMFFRTHSLPRPEYRRVVYLLRDGRDVMVSYFHHLTRLHGKTVDFLRLVKEGGDLSSCTWYEHVEAWLSNPYSAEMIVIRYENLKGKPVDELQRFCTFVGIERDEVFLNRVIEGCSLTKMRQKEIRLGKKQFKARRGEVGSYNDEMPPDVLTAFLYEASDTLRRYGYLL